MLDLFFFSFFCHNTACVDTIAVVKVINDTDWWHFELIDAAAAAAASVSWLQV